MMNENFEVNKYFWFPLHNIKQAVAIEVGYTLDYEKVEKEDYDSLKVYEKNPYLIE